MRLKALIPSGGRGTRLRPITYTNAKQLVPVGGEPVLFRVLRHVADAGIDEAAIVVGDTEDEIRAAVGDGSAFGVRATYVRQAAPAGLADCVRVARDWLGHEAFVMYLGDNMLADGVAGLVEAYRRDPVAAQILTVRVEHPERFGVVTLDAGGGVVRVREKPARPDSNLALAGVYVFGAAVHDVIDRLEPSARGELEITDAIQALLDVGAPVRAFEATGWWKDTGLPDDLLDANRLVLSSLTESRIDGHVEGCATSGTVVVEAGAMVTGGALIGPCVVKADAALHDAVVGPNAAIGAGSRIRGARIEDSIVMDACEIGGVTLTRSLLGRGVGVDGAGAARLIVGDHGSVTLG